MLNNILTYISVIVYNNNCHSRTISWLNLVLIAWKVHSIYKLYINIDSVDVAR